MLAALKLATNLVQAQRETDSSATETIDSVRSVRRRVERRLEKAAANRRRKGASRRLNPPKQGHPGNEGVPALNTKPHYED